MIARFLARWLLPLLVGAQGLVAAAAEPPIRVPITGADAPYSIRADGGAVIGVPDQGVIAGANRRTALRFDAPAGPHAWLNQSEFVSAIAGGPRPGTVVIRVFRVR